MISIDAAETMRLVPLNWGHGNMGWGDWGFSPNHLYQLPRASGAGEVQTTHLEGSRHGHHEFNPCSHWKWDGTVSTPMRNFGTVSDYWAGGIGDTYWYQYDIAYGDHVHPIPDGSDTETFCGYYRHDKVKSTLCSISWSGLTLKVNMREGREDEQIHTYRQWYCDYRIDGMTVTGVAYYREWRGTADSAPPYHTDGRRSSPILIVSTGLSSADISSYRGAVEGRFWNWVHPKLVSMYSPFADPDRDYYMGNASQSCANGFDAVDCNMIANILELPEVGSTLPNILQDIQSPSAKSAADAWLNYRYGDRLTYGDLKQIVSRYRNVIDSLSPDMQRISRGRSVHSWVDGKSYSHEVIYNCMIVVSAARNNLSGYLERLDQLGFLLDAQNAWDLVPYSFAVDWFLNVSDCAAIIDSWFKLNRLEIKTCIESQKGTLVIPSSVLLGFGVGSVRIVRYERYQTSSPAMPVMDLDHLVSTPSWKNFLDGTSLVIGSH